MRPDESDWERGSFADELSDLLGEDWQGGALSSDPPPPSKKRRLEESKHERLQFSPLQAAVWPPLEHAADPLLNL
jgi:hypothetical protein